MEQHIFVVYIPIKLSKGFRQSIVYRIDVTAIYAYTTLGLQQNHTYESVHNLNFRQQYRQQERRVSNFPMVLIFALQPIWFSTMIIFSLSSL